MSGDKRRFLIANAQVLEQLGQVEDMVEDAQAVVNQRLNHGRAPAGAAKARLPRPLINEGSEGGLVRRSQFGRAAGGLRARGPVDPSAAEPADPSDAGLLMH